MYSATIKRAEYASPSERARAWLSKLRRVGESRAVLCSADSVFAAPILFCRYLECREGGREGGKGGGGGNAGGSIGQRRVIAGKSFHETRPVLLAPSFTVVRTVAKRIPCTMYKTENKKRTILTSIVAQHNPHGNTIF